MRFINRKHAISALKNKKQLSKVNEFNKYIITENLCPSNKKIYDECYKLKKQGIIKKLWTYNGIVHVKFTYNEDEFPTKIFHKTDIDYYIK